MNIIMGKLFMYGTVVHSYGFHYYLVYRWQQCKGSKHTLDRLNRYHIEYCGNFKIENHKFTI